jgi:hypothetical protein
MSSCLLIHEPAESVSFVGLPVESSLDDAFDFLSEGLEVAKADSDRRFRSAKVSNRRLWVARPLSFFQNHSMGFNCGPYLGKRLNSKSGLSCITASIRFATVRCRSASPHAGIAHADTRSQSDTDDPQTPLAFDRLSQPGLLLGTSWAPQRVSMTGRGDQVHNGEHIQQIVCNRGFPWWAGDP